MTTTKEVTVSVAAWDDHVSRLYLDGVHESGWAEPLEVKRGKLTVRLLACPEAVQDLMADADYQAEWGCEGYPKEAAMWRRVLQSLRKQTKTNNEGE
jgi:hypothetical protein